MSPAVADRPVVSAVAIHRQADAIEPRFARDLEVAWRVGMGHVDVHRLVAACRVGHVSEIVTALRSSATAAAVSNAARPRLYQAFLAGASIGVDDLAPFGVIGKQQSFVEYNKEEIRVGVSLTAVNPAAVAWARDRAGNLIVGDDVLRATIQEMVVRSQAERIAVRDLARNIREVVGLDPRRMTAVDRFGARLRADRVAPSEIEARMARYAEAQRRDRAMTIARTETITALAHGQEAMWQQAIDRGLLRANRVAKKWIVTDDEILCDICEALGAADPVPIGQPFPGDYMAPTAHPRCRCAVGLVQVEPGTPAAMRIVTPENSVDTLTAWTGPDGRIVPERRALHDRIVREALAGVSPSANPTAYMMGGGPAVGKSSLLNSGAVTVPGPGLAVHIDPDGIKALLPEYARMVAAGDARAAAFAHEESSLLAKRITAEAASMRMDVVIDGTGDGSVDNLLRKVEALQRAGHHVVATYATVDTDMAIERAMARAAKTGRMVPEAFIRDIHQNVSRTFAAALDRGVFERVELFDTSARVPRLVVTGGRGIATTIHDQELWQGFLAKANEAHPVMALTSAETVLGVPPSMAADVERYVGAFGREYTASATMPAGVPVGVPGATYRNATQAVLANHEYTYVEGLAERHGVVYAHAWAADRAGNVIDPTWGADPTVRYFGVPYRTDAYLDHIERNGYYGVLAGTDTVAREIMANGGAGLR